jgi:hypothetical protein
MPRKPSEAARGAASKVWYERITTQPTVHGMIEELALALDDFAATSRGSVDGARWRHRVRGSTYIERDRGSLQASRPELLAEGVEMVSYRAADGTTYYRAAPEFDDGRFERLPDEAKSREPVGEDSVERIAEALWENWRTLTVASEEACRVLSWVDLCERAKDPEYGAARMLVEAAHSQARAAFAAMPPPPEREALRIAQVFIEGLAFLTPVPHERCREILARIRAELGETDE